MVGHTKKSHKKTRLLQSQNADIYHHPIEKKKQLQNLTEYINGDILEVFGGQGNLTEYYKKCGNVTAMTKEKFGDSFDVIYSMRANKKTYNVIDIDSYGYPDKFFPVVGVNCLNGIQEQHFINYWRSSRPTIGDVVGVLTDMALREWYLLQLIDLQKIKRIYRIAFQCTRQKATELCGVKNR